MIALEVTRGEYDKGPVVEIEPVGDSQLWPSIIEDLVKLLSEEFEIEIREKMEGGGERALIVTIESHNLTIYDDFGSRIEICAADKKGQKLLSRVGDFLEQRIPKN